MRKLHAGFEKRKTEEKGWESMAAACRSGEEQRAAFVKVFIRPCIHIHDAVACSLEAFSAAAAAAAGCIEVLKRYNIPIARKNGVVIVHSDIFGSPITMMLNNLDATVMPCHSCTDNIESKVRSADIGFKMFVNIQCRHCCHCACSQDARRQSSCEHAKEFTLF